MEYQLGQKVQIHHTIDRRWGNLDGLISTVADFRYAIKQGDWYYRLNGCEPWISEAYLKPYDDHRLERGSWPEIIAALGGFDPRKPLKAGRRT